MGVPLRSGREAAMVAVAGLTVFVAVVVTLPFTQPGYLLPRQAISETAIGRHGWVMNLAFVVMGVATAGLGIALRRTAGARVAQALLGICAVLDLVSAVFHAVRFDAPATTASTVHQGAGMATFALTIAAMYACVRPFRRADAWRSFATPTLGWAIATTVAMLALGPHNLPHDFGIGQRVMVACFLSWMLVAGVRASRAPEGSAPGEATVTARAGSVGGDAVTSTR